MTGDAMAFGLGHQRTILAADQMEVEMADEWLQRCPEIDQAAFGTAQLGDGVQVDNPHAQRLNQPVVDKPRR